MLRIFIALLLFAAPLSGAVFQLAPNQLVYEGYVILPNGANLNNAESSTYVPGCFGLTDPTPSDGYPGCMAVSNIDSDIWGCSGTTTPCDCQPTNPDSTTGCKGQKGNITLIDLVPPAMSGTASTATTIVKNRFRIVGNVPWASGWETGVGMDEFDLYWDESESRMYWVYYKEYANTPADDDLVFGWTDFVGDVPTPNSTMYRWTSQADADTTGVDPYRATKYTYNIRKMDATVATTYFGGDRMILGPGKSSGSRGSSAGPSAAVRPWTRPTDAGGWDDVVPLSYYNSATGYPRWYTPTAFRGEDDREWGISDRCVGNLFLSVPDGQGNTYEAMITLCGRAIVDTSLYPANTPGAKPTEGTWTTETYFNQCANGAAGCGGVVQGTYSWPNPLYTPTIWYGVEQYDSTPPDYDQQDPSNNDYVPTGSGADGGNRMWGDTNLVSACSHGTGPNGGLARETVWFFWNLQTLSDIYNGVGSTTAETIQPYDAYTIQIDPENDGYTQKDSCIQANRAFTYLAFDDTNLIMYTPRPWTTNGTSNPYARTGQSAYDVYSIDVAGYTPPPPSSSDNQRLTGASVRGGGN